MRKLTGTLSVAFALTSCTSNAFVDNSTTTVKPTSAPANTNATTPAPSASGPTTQTVSTATPSNSAPTSAAPTTTMSAAKKGTRSNPFISTDLPSFEDYKPFALGGIEPVDFAVILKANVFNTPPAAGQMYVRVAVAATYTGPDRGTAFDLLFSVGIAGDKSKAYRATSVADSHHILNILSDQPDVISGGSLIGYLYYLVDSDDANFLGVLSGPVGTQFVEIGA